MEIRESKVLNHKDSLIRSLETGVVQLINDGNDIDFRTVGVVMGKILEKSESTS